MTATALQQDWTALWNPPERLPLSKWVEKNFVLSPEYSSRSGPLELFGWQREIFDAFTDPRVTSVAVKCGTQLVKTLLIQGALAYVIAEEPGPTLLVEPKDADARAFSVERLAPMQRDCTVLHGKLAEANRKDEKNTITYKQFPGGSLSVVGAIAPGNLARRSIRYLFCDEINKYEASAGKEGDPISLARERLATYGTRKKEVLCCSPTDKRGRITVAYEESDQRKPWVACHSCRVRQALKWSQVKWDNKAPVTKRPGTARYECEHCGTAWDDLQRWGACEDAEWRAERPFVGTAGFWISHLYSPHKTLGDIVKQFLAAKKSKETLKTFINTTIAEEWEEKGEVPEWERLYARREDYPFGAEPGKPNTDAVVPAGAVILTAAVDVQEDRLEYEVAGWGRNRERWSIAYGVIQHRGTDGEFVGPSHPELWSQLDKVLMLDWQHESGATMPIMAMAIDTGSRPKPVYDFARRHAMPHYGKFGAKIFPRSVVPIKGSSNPREIKVIAGVSGDDAARKRGGIRIVSIGTGVAKQSIYDALRLPRWSGKGPAPHGYRHCPKYDESFFTGTCSEKRVTHENGTVTWEKQGRNEPLDIAVYHEATAELIGIPRFEDRHWAAWEASLGVKVGEPTTPDGASAKPRGQRQFRGFR